MHKGPPTTRRRSPRVAKMGATSRNQRGHLATVPSPDSCWSPPERRRTPTPCPRPPCSRQAPASRRRQALKSADEKYGGPSARGGVSWANPWWELKKDRRRDAGRGGKSDMIMNLIPRPPPAGVPLGFWPPRITGRA